MQPLRFVSRRILAVLLLGLALAACRVQSGPEEIDPFLVADLFATPGKVLATIELSPTPTATATIPNVPSPTPEPTQPIPTVRVLDQPTLPIGTFEPTPTRPGESTPEPTEAVEVECPQPPPMPFTPVWQNLEQVRRLIGCPSGEVLQVPGVWQNFEFGWMFWRESDRQIFIASEKAIRQGRRSDSWWLVADTWSEGEPDSDPGLEPPAGLLQPVRGFGKVWRGNGFVRDAVGWATTGEQGTAILWQTYDNGWMMTGPDGVPVYVVSAPDGPSQTNGIHLGALPR